MKVMMRKIGYPGVGIEVTISCQGGKKVIMKFIGSFFMCHPFDKTFQFLGNNWEEVVTGSCHCPLELGWHNIIGLNYACHMKPSPGLLQSDDHKECWRWSLIPIGMGMKLRIN